eukprot:TRINITY_DN2876_c0_g1_i2.p1 TRINITY_DN2876_c0_g1~~TRINITY_DN2876_c0_g1_i2.p1  ORF type:complete len:705 (+),score=131.08 TRINITY_DN2876_c0_g1_i2:280-2394(+)
MQFSAKMIIVALVVLWGISYLGWSIYYQSNTIQPTPAPKIDCPVLHNPPAKINNESYIELYGKYLPLSDSLFSVNPTSDAVISLVGFLYSGTHWLSCVTELYSKTTSSPYVSDPPCFNVGSEENQVFGRIKPYTFENGNSQEEVDGKIVLVIRDPLDVLYLAVRDNALTNNNNVGDMDISGITQLVILNYGKFLKYWLSREDISSVFLFDTNALNIFSEVKNKIAPLLRGESPQTEEKNVYPYPYKGSEEEKIVSAMQYMSYLYSFNHKAHSKFDWWTFDGLDQISRLFTTRDAVFSQDPEYSTFREEYKNFLWSAWLKDEKRRDITEKYLQKFAVSEKKLQSITPKPEPLPEPEPDYCSDNMETCVQNINEDIAQVANSIHKIQNMVNEKYSDKKGHIETVKESVQKFQEELENARNVLTKIISEPSERLRIFIGIFSTHTNLDRREAIRETWVNYLRDTPRDDMWDYRFILARTKDKELQKKVEEENAIFKDMVIFDTFLDNYRNLSLKTLELMTYATQNYQTDYVMKIDDDSFLRLDFLMDHLEDAPRTRYYWGKSHGNYYPDRGKGSKWYISPEEYPHNGPGPILIAGPGYLMSFDCAQYLAKRYHEPNYHPIYLEDVNTCLTLNEIGVSGIGSKRFFADAYCEPDMILNHYVWPDIIRRQYRNSLKGNICDRNGKRSIDIAENYEDHDCVSPPTQNIVR